MRAFLLALMSALIVGVALGCSPPEDERCGDSGKYYWDDDWNACFELGAQQPPDTNSDTNPVSTNPDTDTSVLEGLGDPCDALKPGLNVGGCENKEANFCASFMGKTQQCTKACSDLSGHSDCPDDYYCCDFIVYANIPDHCIPSAWWDQLGSPSTCANWKKSR